MLLTLRTTHVPATRLLHGSLMYCEVGPPTQMAVFVRDGRGQETADG